PFTTWCHMATDGELDELHAFAARLGLRRRWFQRDHYDLPPHGRRAAVALGGPPGAGKSTLAARVVDAARVPVLDPDELRDGRDWPVALAAWRTALGAALAAGGAVAVTTALREGHRLGLAKTAA